MYCQTCLNVFEFCTVRGTPGLSKNIDPSRTWKTMLSTCELQWEMHISYRGGRWGVCKGGLLSQVIFKHKWSYGQFRLYQKKKQHRRICDYLEPDLVKWPPLRKHSILSHPLSKIYYLYFLVLLPCTDSTLIQLWQNFYSTSYFEWHF